MEALWVTGTPGTGKSTAGWGLFTRIAEQGGSVAHVDVDQLGLIGPPPGGGDASHAIKEGNARRLLDLMRRRGVRQVIISGIVDPDRPPGWPDLTLVCLRCDREELRRRYLGRGSSADTLDALFEVADEFDRFDTAMDTTGQQPEDTVTALLRHCVVSPGEIQPLSAPAPPPARVIVVSGATAVGKSTAAWGALQTHWQKGIPTAYVDMAQLGFVRPGPDPVLSAACLSALWQGYRDAGAEVLIIVTRDALPQDLFAEDSVTRVLLDADAPTLAERVRRRAAGESALLAGDELRGAPSAVQLQVIARAVAEAERLRRTDQIVLDTTGQDPDETAAALLGLTLPLG
ncbi:AAA family ATPase [Allokutzneria sp. A3M-2-11 16]|uniref:AAA family ATPase n=1 Tax=Allokutzneria sp. A3M-2-11 16 TaxID=2962043 RepID=UPI0020B85C9D|nr:AAA family ATPase [Allokutzneria sp. A3M-2-11 16]MCP3803088.1 AAA family ATPase [Allokutzneria sp. A3M-2-11 16]